MTEIHTKVGNIYLRILEHKQDIVGFVTTELQLLLKFFAVI